MKQTIFTDLFGHRIALNISKTSDERIFQLSAHYKLNEMDLNDVLSQLGDGEREGIFSEVFLLDVEESDKPAEIRFEGKWSIVPDYDSLLDIGMWHHNRNQSENLSKEQFESAYGKNKGEHYFEKWEHFSHNIFSMVTYLKNDRDEGYRFMELIRRVVKQYKLRDSK